MDSQRGTDADGPGRVLGLANVDAFVSGSGFLDPKFSVLDAGAADRKLPVLAVPHDRGLGVAPDLAGHDGVVSGYHGDVIRLTNEVWLD